MKRLVNSLGLAITLMCLTLNLAYAELVTNPGNIPEPRLVVDFSQFTQSFPAPPSPIQVGGLVSKDITMRGSADYGNISYSLRRGGGGFCQL